MVNFETDTIVQVSPRQTITYIYIQRSEELQLAWKEYHTILWQNKNASGKLADVRSCLHALYNRMEAMLKKSLSPEDYNRVTEMVHSQEIEILEKVTYELETFLYSKNITKIDSVKSYDLTRVEMENAAFGL